jgi:hypothetical protein
MTSSWHCWASARILVSLDTDETPAELEQSGQPSPYGE